jgi:RNA polymerase sigma factor (sigma-70 family)
VSSGAQLGFGAAVSQISAWREHGGVADPSDEQLLAATPVDRDAFALFYRRHSAPLLGFLVRRLRDGELAADVCAEVFAVALESAQRFDPERGPALGWLYGIARHKLAHAQQRGFAEDQARRRLAIPPLQLTEEAIERVEALADVDVVSIGEAFAALPSAQQTALHARVIEEEPYDRIAASAGSTEAAIRQRVSRGISGLRSRLGTDRHG